jgi:DNA polymerase-3 subunit epsilon
LAWFVGQAHFCLSHNAAFDRPFVEALCPDIADMLWVCSIKDARWRDWGFDGQVLGYLLAQVGLFNEGSHRAMADVVSLVNLLGHAFDDGTTVIGRILDRARTPSWRVAATGAPYACKGALKRRGYRWNPREEVWATEVQDEQLEPEKLWLEQLVAPFTRTPTITRLTAHERYR